MLLILHNRAQDASQSQISLLPLQPADRQSILQLPGLVWFIMAIWGWEGGEEEEDGDRQQSSSQPAHPLQHRTPPEPSALTMATAKNRGLLSALGNSSLLPLSLLRSDLLPSVCLTQLWPWGDRCGTAPQGQPCLSLFSAGLTCTDSPGWSKTRCGLVK